MMKLFGNAEPSETTIRDCVGMVTRFFDGIDMREDQQRLNREEGIGWFVKRGSAAIYIMVNETDWGGSLRVECPILHLPADKILPLYRRCLEHNMDLVQCAFAVSDSTVCVVSERPISGLDADELKTLINFVSVTADKFDDELADEFGAALFLEDEERSRSGD